MGSKQDKNLVIGNGVNIQFSRGTKSPYCNKNIIKFITKDINSIYYINKEYLLSCAKFNNKDYRDILLDEYVDYFNKLYLNNNLELVLCNEAKEYLKLLPKENRGGFLYTLNVIFALEKIYKRNKIEYPKKFIEYIKDKDYVFTTNYDYNIENNTEVEVYHIHGDFNNKNCILKSGNKEPELYKEVFGMMYVSNVSEKEYKNIENIIETSTICKANEIKDAFERTLNNSIAESYNKLKNISGEIEILGLSPKCDEYMFNILKNNKEVTKVVYYYLYETEKKNVEGILIDYDFVEYRNVKDFWKEMT